MREKLLSALEVFEKSRETFVSRTLSESPDLFKYLFEFEGDFDVLTLIYEREKINFINSNMASDDCGFKNISRNSILRHAVCDLIAVLRDKSSGIDGVFVDKIKDIYDKEISFLDRIVSIESDSASLLRMVDYQRHKENALFGRLLKKMEESNDVCL